MATQQHTYVDGQVFNAADINDELNQLYTNITGSNLASPFAYPQASSVAGVTTAGSLGIPGVVQVASRTHISDTSSHNLVSFTPSATGLYVVKINLNIGNSTSGNDVSCTVSYHDPDAGATETPAVAAEHGGTFAYFGGSTSIANNIYFALPMLISADTTAKITVAFQDPTNTPNDYISVTVIREA